MAEAAYPLTEQGYPAPNIALVPDAARPRFTLPAEAAFRPDDTPAIVVIGAGFTGLSAALHLAEARRATGVPVRIVVLERQHVAAGPSGKSAGHICGLQASADAVRDHCGNAPGDRLIAAATGAADLVRSLIARHAIPCDLRDGYVLIGSDGRQSVTHGGPEFGIDAYPYALGLAFAAARCGAEIYEGVEVTGLHATPGGCRVVTNHGEIVAAHVLACGGHRMAETIALLAPLRRTTTELRVSTIITDPLPDPVLRRAMPEADGRRFPFANDAAEVAYGSIDRANRLVFGARAAAYGDPDFRAIVATLTRLLPSLLPDYRVATGQDLAWRPLVSAETLCFTREFLPNVGSVAGHPGILYVQALGGHGIAVGTLLGKAAAAKLWSLRTGIAGGDTTFDAFAAVRHGWLPSAQPWRSLAAWAGLHLRRSPYRAARPPAAAQ